MKLNTARLTFRLVENEDLNDVHALHSIPEVDEFNTLGIPESIGDTRKVVMAAVAENSIRPIKNYTFAIELKDTNEFLGLFGFKLGSEKYRRGEIWYKLLPKVWGKGYATEAVKRILDFGFDDLKLHRIEAGCAVDNLGSIRVLEKVGMTREGRMREILPLKTGWSDNYEFAILESDDRG